MGAFNEIFGGSNKSNHHRYKGPDCSRTTLNQNIKSAWLENLLTVAFLLLLLCCKPVVKTENKTENKLTSKPELPIAIPVFNFTDFKIMKGQLGNIKIGMTMAEAEKQFSGLIKKTDEAGNFGFDGGGNDYLYYQRDTIVFGLIPKRENDTLLAIIAVHNKLQTTNMLNPNSTVDDIIKQYPGQLVYWNLMNDWEEINDVINNWDFVFLTQEKIRIGEYPDMDKPSKPKRLEAKADWITIK